MEAKARVEPELNLKKQQQMCQPAQFWATVCICLARWTRDRVIRAYHKYLQHREATSSLIQHITWYATWVHSNQFLPILCNHSVPLPPPPWRVHQTDLDPNST